MAGLSFLPGPGYRFKQGDYLVYTVSLFLTANNTAVTLQSRARVAYDDGTEGTIEFPVTVFTPTATGAAVVSTAQGPISAPNPMPANGWLLEWEWQSVGTTSIIGATWVQGFIAQSNGAAAIHYMEIGKGIIGQNVSPGYINAYDPDYWATLVIQGTVAEDATVGTHVCTLTVTPGLGGAIEIIAGQIISTGSASVQVSAYVTDGTNLIYSLLDAQSSSGTYDIPSSKGALTGDRPFRICSTMTLVLSAATATVSDTQTFSLALRCHPAKVPSAVLGDNTGTPTTTLNTFQVF